MLTKFKAALEDFFEQTGQTKDVFKPYIFPVGGDGLTTYKKMVQLHDYLQLHSNNMESMRVMKPMLEWWHTEWTNLSRIFEAHWGVPLSNDPSLLDIARQRLVERNLPISKRSISITVLVRHTLFLTSGCWTAGGKNILSYSDDDYNRLYFKQENISFFEGLAKKNELPPFEDPRNFS